ncbi:succinate--CoA ligase subunit beta [Algicella marina]|uniref:Succinyl-CoA synthetase subunit beta n=1 Tax=Algicella marina TaxID=2683284 RepID=A0A6P1SYB1_9RHOB|nr:ATP-grasp domain-containing protein [Algicella marina]QHQ34196.1 succinyl-CoA synthetase subunit beta [Algicella marina]
MNLSEHRSKELLAQYGIPIPAGRFAETAQEAEARCREIDAKKYVVKAQIAAGGRGLAGGIRFAATPSAVRAEADAMIGKPLVTEQTGPVGQIVKGVYVEAAVDASQSYYVALLLDPETARPVLLASLEGGVEFEKSAANNPGIVRRLLLGGTSVKEITSFLSDLGLPDAEGAAGLIVKMEEAFVANDMLLAEINPLVAAPGGWLAVDAKVSLDGNAMFRHPELEALVEDQNLSPAEKVAQENEINLVKLDGNIGVVVNGAGLGLVTNDMLTKAGGVPANFMDIRTTATSFHISRGVQLLLEDPNVTIILVNVHGGGMTVCDTVAEGIAFAYSKAQRSVPIVARFAGQSADWAHKILSDRMLPVEKAANMTNAIERAVAKATGEAKR